MAAELTVALLTFRRPDVLLGNVRRILPQLEAASHAVEGGLTARLLVVDNDTEPSAQHIVDEDPLMIRYVHEPVPGISAARNRAFDESASSDLLVFIDDDIHPQEGWLAAMLATWERTNCTAVMGLVVPVYESTPDAWIVAGRFFKRRERPTGEILHAAATSNLLLDMAQVRRFGLRFDPDLGLLGGEDTMFSRQLVRAGGIIRWCNEAETEDQVPNGRINRRWVLLRAFRTGSTEAIVDLKLLPRGPSHWLRRGVLCAGGFGRLAAGGIRWLAGKASGSLEHQARGLRMACRGAGFVFGSAGLTYFEYGRGPRKFGRVTAHIAAERATTG